MVTHDPELAARAQRNVHVIDGQVVDLVPDRAFKQESEPLSARLQIADG
jgi:putative ABC transport system ATP-binding protein